MRGLFGFLLVVFILVGVVLYLIVPHLVANNRSNAVVIDRLDQIKNAIENISFGEIRLENITLELGEIYAYILNQSLPVHVLNPGFYILNNTLPVYITNTPIEARIINTLDVFIRNNPGVYILNTSLPVHVLNSLLDVRVMNNLGVFILNSSLPVHVLNSLLDVRITNNPGVYILNSSIPVTGTVNIANTPLDTRVVNNPGVHILNTSLAVYFSPPVRHYYVAHIATSGLSANRVHLCIWNANSTLVLYVTRIVLASEVTGAVTGFQVVFRIQRITGISGGTALAIVPWDTNSPSLTNVQALTQPTVTGAVNLMSVALNQEETGGDVHRDIVLDNYPIPVRFNQGLCVTQYGTAGTGSVSISIVFYIQP